MAPTPAPEGSLAARFAAMLVHHMRVGTRPARKRGTGAWSPYTLAVDVGLSRRTIENYASGRTLPPDVSAIADAFFGNDPRHVVARNAFLIAFAEATATEPPPWAFATSNIPVRVPTHFMGRDESLTLIHAALQPLQRYEGRVAITVLHGMRGVGKTVLAAAYADRQRAAYRATWWLRAQTEPTLRADMVGLGVRLGWVAAGEKEDPAIATVMEQLRLEGDGILLIYDNAIDARGLAPSLPRGGAARIIVTSNAHAWRDVAAEPVEIRLWPKEIGADYLIARTGRTGERDAAEALSVLLGGLPLALEMAAAYCEHLDVALADYACRFSAAPVRFLDDHRRAPAEYHDGLTVAKTFGLAIAEAARLHPAAETLIGYAALLAPEAIPLFLFQKGRTLLGEPLATLLADDGLDEAIAALRVFALVDREAIADERLPEMMTDSIRLHRLVSEVARSRCGDGARVDTNRRLLETLAFVYPATVFNDRTTWPQARRLDGHGLALVDSNSVPKGAEKAAGNLLDRLASYRSGALGDYNQARPLFERALAVREKKLGPDDPATAESLSHMGSVLQTLGNYQEALPYFTRALAICENTQGLDHLDTAFKLNDYALLLCALGGSNNLATARSLLDRALSIREDKLGREAHETATTLNNLGLVLQSQGEFAEALAYYERALKIRENGLEPEGIHTARVLDNLGRLYYEMAHFYHDMGHLSLALPYIRRGRAIRENLLEPTHPDTATSLRSLGWVLQDQGALDEARPLLEHVLTVDIASYGPDHHLVRDDLESLVRLYEDKGDLTAALPLRERLLAMPEKEAGSENINRSSERNRRRL